MTRGRFQALAGLLVAAVCLAAAGAGATARLRRQHPARVSVGGNAAAQLESGSLPAVAVDSHGPPTTMVGSGDQVPTPAKAVSPGAAAPSHQATGGGSVFSGLGTWVDVFDYDPAHTGGRPTVSPDDVNRMAGVGVRTLYLQAARSEDPAAPGDLVDPGLLSGFLQRAHAKGMRVVAWYLPHLGDVGDDLRHLQAISGFSAKGQHFDGIGLDVEWRDGVPDAGSRSANLVELSARLRRATRLTLGAIVMPPVVTDVINPGFWPGFPWRGLRPLFDAWLPMSYWTERSPDSPYRDAYRYSADNVRLLRQDLGDAKAPVHVIGGIGDASTIADYQRFVSASSDTAAVGRSVYDWATTAPGAWPVLRK